ncbi:MAG: TetR/AcrR family transcriptional regulator [Verrucomicrobiota bacterium]
MDKTDSATRQKILDAALRQFAHCGYAGTSVQAIVDSAKVTKPTLYYYFANKAALYKALVDSAHDERYRLMQEASDKNESLQVKLVEILAALFGFSSGRRELMRLAFATAFASPGELPEKMNYCEKPKRNFEFVHSLIKRELKAGRLNRRFNSEELAYGFWGLMNIYIMAHLMMPDCRLNRKTAEGIVALFLQGAAAKGS